MTDSASGTAGRFNKVTQKLLEVNDSLIKDGVLTRIPISGNVTVAGFESLLI